MMMAHCLRGYFTMLSGQRAMVPRAERSQRPRRRNAHPRSHTRPIRRIGGSHAQRALFEEMLIASALRAGEAETAKRLLAERLEQRPRNAWAWGHLAAAFDALGERDGASGARAKAMELR